MAARAVQVNYYFTNNHKQAQLPIGIGTGGGISLPPVSTTPIHRKPHPYTNRSTEVTTKINLNGRKQCHSDNNPDRDGCG